MLQLVSVLFLLAIPASGEQIVWAGGTGAWGTPQQWRPARVPVYPDHVLVETAGTSIALPATENATARVLLLDATDSWIRFPTDVRHAYVCFGPKLQAATTVAPTRPSQQRQWVGGTGNWAQGNLWQPPVVPCGNDVAVLPSGLGTPSVVQLADNRSTSAVLARARGSWLSFAPGARNTFLFLSASGARSCTSSTASPATSSNSRPPTAPGAPITTTQPSVVSVPPGSIQDDESSGAAALIAGIATGVAVLLVVVVLLVRRKRKRDRSVVALPRAAAAQQATLAVYENPTFDTSSRYALPTPYMVSEAVYELEAADAVPGSVGHPKTLAFGHAYDSSLTAPANPDSIYENIPRSGSRATRFWDPSLYSTDVYTGAYDSVS